MSFSNTATDEYPEERQEVMQTEHQEIKMESQGARGSEREKRQKSKSRKGGGKKA